MVVPGLEAEILELLSRDGINKKTRRGCILPRRVLSKILFYGILEPSFAHLSAPLFLSAFISLQRPSARRYGL